uniref:Ancient ubiquitous protein 1 n=1 Tax=Mus musculus TaxID=10090 RepID=A0A0N4SW79_MOUSE
MEPPPAPGPERLFDSHRLPSDGFLLLALLLYAPVGLCLLVLRLFLGLHVFLVRGTNHVCGPGARGPAGGLRTPRSPRQGPYFQPRNTF